jgi:hypothetical protein
MYFERRTAMIVVERQIQKVRPGKWEELHKLDMEFNSLEAGLGFPPKKRYQCLVGSHDIDTLIIEREWENMAVMEKAYETTMTNPAYQKLAEKLNKFVKSVQFELYLPLP